MLFFNIIVIHVNKFDKELDKESIQRFELVSFFNLTTFNILFFNYCYLWKIYTYVNKIDKELGSDVSRTRVFS